MTRSRSIRTSIYILMALLVLPTSARAFEITCQVFEAGSSRAKYSFRPGEKMRVKLVIDIPEKAMQKQMTIKTKLKIKAFGFKLSKSLKDFVGIPSSDDRLRAAEPFRKEPADVNKPVSVEWEREIKLPESMPASSADVNITVKIKKFGSRKCRQTVTVR